MTSLAQSERAAFADLLEQVGPDQPTLCSGWRTRDLAAHVVVRERRPDAAVGIVVGPLAAYTASVQGKVATTPWPELVAKVRRRSPLVVGPVDDLINTTEFFVHLEDVRRAVPGWQPRPTDEHLERGMWRVLRSRGRAFFRRSPMGVVLELPDGTRHVVREGQPRVTIVGPATELLLYAYGRTAHARVQIQGDPDDVAAFSSSPLAA